MQKRSTSETGGEAERLAEGMLTGAGLSIVARNFRCRHGEIDLVALEADTWVFCEVRLRRNSTFGGAAESITVHKQRRVIAAARYFLARRVEAPCRFDVILFDTLQENRGQWIRDAFAA